MENLPQTLEDLFFPLPATIRTTSMFSVTNTHSQKNYSFSFAMNIYPIFYMANVHKCKNKQVPPPRVFGPKISYKKKIRVNMQCTHARAQYSKRYRYMHTCMDATISVVVST